MRYLEKFAAIALVVADFLTPNVGLIQASAQAVGPQPASGDSWAYQSQDTPPQDIMPVDQLGRNRMAVKGDGSIYTNTIPPNYVTYLAANCSAANGSVTVSTITPPPGLYIYVMTWYAITVDDGTGGSPQAAVSWPVLNGVSYGSSAGTLKFSFADTVDTSLVIINDTYNPPLKATKAGTLVSNATPTGATHTLGCVRISYYIAP